MKKIVVTQRLLENESYHEVREALDINYCSLLQECGYLPIVLPYEVDFKKYFNDIGIDGVLLSGGNDLNVCSKNSLSKKRDEFEVELLEYCIEQKIPVFGICRGMQLIAHYFGSSFKKVENEVNVRNKLIVKSGSLYVSTK